MTERRARGRSALLEALEHAVIGSAAKRVRRPASTQTRDYATRERLLDAAGQLFAKDGYRHVTVRDIARVAEANLAAVNYHFGDKLRLYLSVVEAAIESVRGMVDGTMLTDPRVSPEEKLRHYVHANLARILTSQDRIADIVFSGSSVTS